MPIYSYKCDACENVQDELRLYQNREIASICTKCGEPTRKIPTVARYMSLSGKLNEKKRWR